jgi:hypothetical protein
VLDGKIAPKIANSALFAVSGAAKALELETAERVSHQLEQVQERPSLLTYDNAVVEGVQ